MSKMASFRQPCRHNAKTPVESTDGSANQTGLDLGFIEGIDRDQASLLPTAVDDCVAADALVRVVDAFVASLDLGDLGFGRTLARLPAGPASTRATCCACMSGGYLNQVRHRDTPLERACVRDLEALWLLRRLAPDYRTIAAFRHYNPEAIVAASAAFIQFCRASGLVSGRLVALERYEDASRRQQEEHRWG
jgi:transposase